MSVSFTITKPVKITLDYQQPLEDLIAQLIVIEADFDRLIMVLNGAELRCYSKLQDVPRSGYRLEATDNRFGVNLYHLRSLDTDDLLVCYNATLAERMTQQ
jgi:hypothetical protein